MAMKITQEFEVGRSAGTVFEFFQNVPEVAKCLPGAELTEDKGGGVYAGKVSVQLGPMTAGFEGEATVVSDPESRAGRIVGKGADKQGGSRGQVKVDYSIAGADTGAVVTVEAEITISGAAAQFGRTGLVNQISQRLIGDFVHCLEAKLGAETTEVAEQIEAGKVKGFSLMLGSMWSGVTGMIKKLFRRG